MDRFQKIIIVYLVPSLSRTGPTRQLLNLIQNLDFDKFKPLLLSVSPLDKSGLLQDFNQLSIDVHSLNVSRSRTLFCGLPKLHAFLRNKDIDLIHSQGLRADLLSSFLPKSYVRIATRRNLPYLDYTFLHGPVVGRLLAQLHLIALRRLDLVIVCANSLRATEKYSPDSEVVIPNGVDLSDVPLISSDNSNLASRSSLDLPLKKRIFIFSGPLILRKNLALVIKAFRNKEREGDILLIVGDGPEMASLRSQSSQLPNVIFTGMVEDVSPYLQSADCFISASLAEGMPNSVLEALAHGVPVILSDIPAHKEVLDYAEDVGWLFSLDSENSLNSLLTSVDLSLKSRSNVQSAAYRSFSAEKMSQSYQNLYAETISG